MENMERRFECANLPEQVVETIRQYEAELKQLTGRKLILIAYEETIN